MPAIAVVAAFGTISAGAAMGGILGGIMIAGGVMSGLGAVTGNKTLSTLGAVASLGAGLGSAMGLAASANGAWNAAVGADSAFAVTGKSFLDAGGSMSAIGEALGRGGGQTAGMGGAASTPVGGTTNMNMPLETGGELGANGIVPAGTGTDSAILGASAQGAAASGSQAPGLIAKAAGPSAPAGAMASSPMGQQAPGLIDKSLAFMNGNPEVVKAGSGLVAGAMTNYEKQRSEEAALSAENERRARFNRSILEQRRKGY